MSKQMMKFRRKEGAGTMIVAPRTGSPKSRHAKAIRYNPRDEILVEKKDDLPGYPHSIDGWEYVETLDDQPSSPPQPKEEIGPEAVLRMVHVRVGKYQVVIDQPGYNWLGPDGSPLRKGVKVHPGFLDESAAKALVGE